MTARYVAKALSRRRLDAALAVIAALILLPTLWYRYGIDQALYDYFGSGWLQGRVPYRDAFDIKPPGIYGVYALSIALLGHHQASIRILEAAAILVSAYLIGESQDGEAKEGVAGSCAVLLAAWHATLFGFWDTGQAELWQSVFIVASYWLVVRYSERRTANVLAGASASCAVLMKVTAFPAVLVLVAVLGLRDGMRPRLARIGAFTTGLVGVLVSTVGYFVAVGAGPRFFEWLLYLHHYGRAPLDPAWVTSTGPELFLIRCWYWLTILGACAILQPVAGPVALLLTTFLGIVIQRRWFSYHGAVLGPVLVLAASGAIHRAAETRAARVSLVALVAALGSIWSAAAWTGNPALNYRVYTFQYWLPYLRNRITTGAFDGAFAGAFDYRYADHVAASKLIESRRPRPEDTLHVRGFDPTMYTLTGLFSPSRFMMESPLEDAYLRNFRPEWRAEHEKTLFGRASPRFFVTKVGNVSDLHALRQHGYGLLGSRGPFAVLENGLEQRTIGESELRSTLSGAALEGHVAPAIPFTAKLENASFELLAGGKRYSGTYRIEGSSTCVRAEGIGTCFTLYFGDDEYLAATDDGREIARFRRVR